MSTKRVCIFRFAIVVAIILFSTKLSFADWIKGKFSEKAGIDSIERFLVIRDIDSCRILGDPIIPLGDINKDGCSDIIIARKAAGCLDTNSSFLCYGGRPPDGIFDQVFSRFRIIAATIGDINGDGFDDLGNFQCIPDWRTEILLGGENFNDSADYVIPNTLSFLCQAADLNNDGFIEFALSKDMGTGRIVNVYRIGPTEFDTIPKYIFHDTSKNFGDNLTTGDFNGDGYPDLAIAAYLNRDSSFVKFYWGGPDFDTIPDFEIWRIAILFGETLLPLGDFNGDGYEDILIDGGVADGWSIPGGVFFGGPDIDNTLDIVTNRYTYGGYLSARSASVAGDVNHDGYPDLIIGNDNDYSFLFEARVFLGGPDADSIPDVYLENRLITSRQIDFGAVVAGIGDFNGDGIDDFAVRSRTSSGCCWWGEVNFFAGWDSNATDVDDDNTGGLPSSLELSQNYPNPFNSATVIEFTLPRSERTNLSVYNLLGQRVSTILDRDLSAGTHRVTWNPQTSDGRALSSGIYIYWLMTGSDRLTRSMLFLK